MFTEMMWFLAFIAFLILEGITYQLVSVWFAVGALGALSAKLLGMGDYVQTAVFLIISAVLICLVRPLSLKLLKSKPLKNNIQGLIGKQVLIIEDVDNIHQTGKGKINGMEWTVRSENNEQIKSGSIGEITKIEGVKLIVKEFETVSERI